MIPGLQATQETFTAMGPSLVLSLFNLQGPTGNNLQQFSQKKNNCCWRLRAQKVI